MTTQGAADLPLSIEAISDPAYVDHLITLSFLLLGSRVSLVDAGRPLFYFFFSPSLTCFRRVLSNHWTAAR
jgi:hypothetical protein